MTTIPYTDADVELVRSASRNAPCPACGRTTACRCRLTDDQAGYRWRAILDALAAAGRLATHGRCGDRGPTITGIPAATCALAAGHAGWHRGDDGSEWTPRGLSPALEEHIRAGADALVRLRTQAPSLSELDADEQAPWLSDARAVLMAAGGLTPSGRCPCTCHQPGQCPCKADAPEHRHGAGGYCTVIPPGGHVLDVDAIGWTIHHPTDCTVTPRAGGPSGVICLIDETAREELDRANLAVGRYEVWAADTPDHAGGYLRIGDRLPDDAPLPAGARTASTCRCEDAEGRRWDHPHGTGLVCGQTSADPTQAEG